MMILSTSDRRYGIHVAASRGSGKSRFLGRYLAFTDFLAGIPTIVMDNGDTIDNLLDRITRLPLDLQKELWPRVRYVDLSGLSGRVVPFPLYYRLGTETDLTVASRLVRTILKIDPELRGASVQGKTAIVESGYTSGVALVQRGWQVSELEQLSMKIAPTYRVRLLPMLLDDIQRATYCASVPGIDWQEVIAKKQIVLLDYRFVEDPEFILTWILSYLLVFIQHRGTHRSPISLIIDELSAFQAAQSQSSFEFFKDLNVLINTIMRRYNFWLTIGHQDLGQFSEEIQNLLLTLDTQLIGKTNSMASARKLAAHFYRVDPKKAKRSEIVWRPSVDLDQYGGGKTRSFRGEQNVEAHETVVDYSVQEQIQEAAYVFTDKLPRFAFLVRSRDGRVQKVSYADFEPGIYPRKQVVAQVRDWLMERDGRKVEDILAEIAARTAPLAAEPAPSQVQEAERVTSLSPAKTLPIRTKGTLKSKDGDAQR